MLHGKIANLPTLAAMKRTISPLVISLLGCVWLIPAQASSIQSLESIRSVVKAYVLSQHIDSKDNIKVDVSRLDSRLKLVKCPAPLQAFLPPGGKTTGNISVGVRCRDEQKPWSIYVAARVSEFAKVLVASRSLPRGKHLAPGDVRLERRNIAKLYRGYLSQVSEINGKLLKRTVSPGMVLTTTMLSKPRLVKRGELISILARSKVLEVRMRGEALAGGGIGDVIRARNLNTRKIVQGTITSDGSLEVRL
jgi:flagella basal body P-ring formation protein FlgA